MGHTSSSGKYTTLTIDMPGVTPIYRLIPDNHRKSTATANVKLTSWLLQANCFNDLTNSLRGQDLQDISPLSDFSHLVSEGSISG